MTQQNTQIGPDLITTKARELAEWATGGVTPNGLADGAVESWAAEFEKQMRSLITGLPIEQICEEALANAKNKGFLDEVGEADSDNPRNPIEVAGLIHSEVSEFVEDMRCPVVYWNENGIAFDVHGHHEGRALEIPPHRDIAEFKPVGPAVEMADALIRIAEYCEYRGWNLARAIRFKMAYNRTRPHKHGGRKF